jgi:hypothetical protein
VVVVHDRCPTNPTSMACPSRASFPVTMPGQFILNQDADCAHPHSNAVKAALFFISAVGSLPTWLFHGRRRHSSVLAQSSTLASAIDRAGGQSNYPKMHANPTVLVHWQPEAQTAAGKQLPLR